MHHISVYIEQPFFVCTFFFKSACYDEEYCGHLILWQISLNDSIHSQDCMIWRGHANQDNMFSSAGAIQEQSWCCYQLIEADLRIYVSLD